MLQLVAVSMKPTQSRPAAVSTENSRAQKLRTTATMVLFEDFSRRREASSCADGCNIK
jgi:hypothetical protein